MPLFPFPENDIELFTLLTSDCSYMVCKRGKFKGIQAFLCNMTTAQANSPKFQILVYTISNDFKMLKNVSCRGLIHLIWRCWKYCIRIILNRSLKCKKQHLKNIEKQESTQSILNFQAITQIKIELHSIQFFEIQKAL